MQQRVGSWWSVVCGAIVLSANVAGADATPPEQVREDANTGALLTGQVGVVQARLAGLIHMDGNFFVDNNNDGPINEVSLRRIRPQVDGTVGDLIAFRIMPEFGRGQVRILDAFADLHLARWASFRLGRFKSPVGLQFVQAASARSMEMGLPSQLVPRRDIGVQLSGVFLGGALVYHVALLNGAPDGSDLETSLNIDDNFDFAGRLVVRPFLKTTLTLLRGLGLGFGGVWGKFDGQPGEDTTGLTAIRSVSLQPIFRYRADLSSPNATAYIDGPRYNLSPHLIYAWQRLGLVVEFARSSSDVRLGATTARLNHWAWLIQPSVMLTRDRWQFSGIDPAMPYSLGGAGWGALELVGRYNELTLDQAAFPTFADPAGSVEKARAAGGGINWHLTSHYRLSTYFERTWFRGGARGGANRNAENYLLARLQVAY